MYNLLTTKELTALQSMLFEATEAAFHAVTAKNENPAWFARYRPFHRELGDLFIEVATELLLRFDQDAVAALPPPTLIIRQPAYEVDPWSVREAGLGSAYWHRIGLHHAGSGYGCPKAGQTIINVTTGIEVLGSLSGWLRSARLRWRGPGRRPGRLRLGPAPAPRPGQRRGAGHARVRHLPLVVRGVVPAASKGTG